MAVYSWYCTCQNRTMNWKDHWACGAYSKYWFRDRKKAESAGKAHERKEGHYGDVKIQTIDGRRVKGKIR